MIKILIKKFLRKPFLGELTQMMNGLFFDDDNDCVLWTFAGDELSSIEGECEVKWGNVKSGGCNRGVNESKEDIWIEDWENYFVMWVYEQFL